MLTFAGRVPRPSIAYGHAWRHFRQAAELSSQPYARLLIALRQELGEHNGRLLKPPLDLSGSIDQPA